MMSRFVKFDACNCSCKCFVAVVVVDDISPIIPYALAAMNHSRITIEAVEIERTRNTQILLQPCW